MQVKSAERDLGGDVLAGCCRARRRASACAPLRRLAALRRAPGSASSPVRYWPVSELGFAMISSGVPCGDDLAAVDAGAGADVDDVVGRAGSRPRRARPRSRVLPRSRRRLQRLEQALVVALVQADRRLVEHVEHAGQARADLARPGGCAGSRRRTACRSRAPASGSRGPTSTRKRQALADLLEDPAGDLVLLGGRAGSAAPSNHAVRVAHRQRRDLADVPAGDLHRQRLGLQAVAAAGRAGRLAT